MRGFKNRKRHDKLILALARHRIWNGSRFGKKRPRMFKPYVRKSNKVPGKRLKLSWKGYLKGKKILGVNY